jgi:hypothetical protein
MSRWWGSAMPSAITPPSQRKPLFSAQLPPLQPPPPLGHPPLQSEPETDEPRIKAARRNVVHEDESDGDTEEQAIRNALAADEEDIGLFSDGDDSEPDAEMTDEEEVEEESAGEPLDAAAAAAIAYIAWVNLTLASDSSEIAGKGTNSRPSLSADAEYPDLIARVQQDNNDKSKDACTQVFGSLNDDCSVHFQRHLEKRLQDRNKRPAPDAPSVLECLQRDFNRCEEEA